MATPMETSRAAAGGAQEFTRHANGILQVALVCMFRPEENCLDHQTRAIRLGSREPLGWSRENEVTSSQLDTQPLHQQIIAWNINSTFRIPSLATNMTLANTEKLCVKFISFHSLSKDGNP